MSALRLFWLLSIAVSNRPALLAIFGFTSGLWLVCPTSWRPNRGPDYLNTYKPVAESLLDGRGLVMPHGGPAVRYPPGHSLFLAGVFAVADRLAASRDLMMAAVSIALHAGTATLLGWFAARFWGTGLSLVSAVLWATYLPALWELPLFGSDTPYIPLLLAAVVTLWISVYGARLRYCCLILSGVCLGLAMLLRPIALPVPPVLAALIIARAKTHTWQVRILAAAVFLVACVTTVMPWEIWMYQRLGQVQILSTGGLPSVIDGLTYARPEGSKVPLSVAPDVESFMFDLNKADADGTIKNGRQLAGWLLEQAADRPAPLAKILAAKIGRCWYVTDSHRRETALLMLQIPYLGLALLGVIWAWRRGGQLREMALLVLSVVLCTWLMAFLVVSLVRYMVPVMDLLFLLAPAGLAHALGRLRRAVPCPCIVDGLGRQ